MLKPYILNMIISADYSNEMSHKFPKNIKLFPSARKMGGFALSLNMCYINLFSWKHGKQLKIYWSVSKEDQEPCNFTNYKKSFLRLNDYT